MLIEAYYLDQLILTKYYISNIIQINCLNKCSNTGEKIITIK